MARPDQLRIALEDEEYGRFKTIGRLSNGEQFMAFITGAFPTGEKYYLGDDWQFKKRWLAVVHRFDAEGNHLGSEARLGGGEIEGREVYEDRAEAHLRTTLDELGGGQPPEFGDIRVKLFSVEIDGITYGLFYEQSEEEPEEGEDSQDWVMLEPNDLMFHPPWDSGDYSS